MSAVFSVLLALGGLICFGLAALCGLSVALPRFGGGPSNGEVFWGVVASVALILFGACCFALAGRVW